MSKLNKITILLVICICCFVGCGKNDENEAANGKINRKPTAIETSKYSKDLCYFDEINHNVIRYLNDESAVYEKNTGYTLTELIALDKENIIIKGSSGLYTKENDIYKLNMYSEAFDGITTDNIIVYVREEDVSLYVAVNSEFADKYEDYETGPVKFVFD